MKRMLMQFAVTCTGLALIAYSVYQAIFSEDQVLHWGVIHIPSLIMVTGTLMGYAMISFQSKSFGKALRQLVFDSPAKLDEEIFSISSQLKSLSEDYYNRGSAALRQFTERGALPNVWRTLLHHMEAKVPEGDLRSLMNYDANRVENESNHLIGLVNSLATIAPSVGMLGTVLGLVRLLKELQNINALGAHMSMALLSTLYGIFFGILIFNPLATRLQQVRDMYLKAFDQALFWVHLIENHKPAFYCDADFVSQAQNRG